MSCRDPFDPEIVNQDLHYLVVEGYIEVGGEESILTLTRTSSIKSEMEPMHVANANIRLISESGESWMFAENSIGRYSLSSALDPGQIYTLEIDLLDGSAYKSDPLKPLISPPIDSLGFLMDEAGIEIFVSTRGNEDAEYFLWDYAEHWIFEPGIKTNLKFENGRIFYRDQDDRIDKCWSANLFPRIILQNSARFQDNTIFQRELIRIPPRSEKLTQRYNITVRQRALDQKAYDFWEILRKNSEDIGGIFSPLPSLLKSNLHPINPEMPQVIGHISIGRSVTKSLYINNREVAPWYAFIPEYDQCFIFPDTISVDFASTAFLNSNIVPAMQVYNDQALIGYRATSRMCADCTLRGSNRPPDFWVD